MTLGQRLSACACLAAALFSLGACAGGGGNSNAPAANSTATGTPAAATASPASGAAPAETGIEKVKPAPGTGNVQGKVLFNGKPAAGIEVKLCEKFNQFFGGCSGQTFTAKSDEGGEYVITNVAPKTYESLMARVFDTDSYVFATTGLLRLKLGQVRGRRRQDALRAPDAPLQRRPQNGQPRRRAQGQRAGA